MVRAALRAAPDILVAVREAMWQAAAAGRVSVVGDAARAGHALLTLAVGDLDRAVTALAGRGVVAGASETAPHGRSVALAHPEGNRIARAADLGAGD